MVFIRVIVVGGRDAGGGNCGTLAATDGKHNLLADAYGLSSRSYKCIAGWRDRRIVLYTGLQVKPRFN